MRVALLLLSLAAASAQIPHIYPRVLAPGDPVDSTFWLLAPDVAIVRVENAVWEGPEWEITPPQVTVVRLVRVTADVENVVHGDLPTGRTTFYMFANTLSRNGFHTVLSWPEAGGRYVVFLRKDGEVLRTLGDVETGAIRIWSGRHNVLPTPQPGDGDLVGPTIVRTALAPTGGAEQGFATNIERIAPRLFKFAPAKDIVILLRNLLNSRDADVREQACLTLIKHYRYRDACGPDLLRSEDETVRQQATIWLQKQTGTAALVNALKTSPLSLSVSDRVQDLAGDLELFTFDEDAGVRTQACDTLRTLFPGFEGAACTGSRTEPPKPD